MWRIMWRVELAWFGRVEKYRSKLVVCLPSPSIKFLFDEWMNVWWLNAHFFLFDDDDDDDDNDSLDCWIDKLVEQEKEKTPTCNLFKMRIKWDLISEIVSIATTTAITAATTITTAMTAMIKRVQTIKMLKITRQRSKMESQPQTIKIAAPFLAVCLSACLSANLLAWIQTMSAAELMNEWM